MAYGVLFMVVIMVMATIHSGATVVIMGIHIATTTHMAMEVSVMGMRTKA